MQASEIKTSKNINIKGLRLDTAAQFSLKFLRHEIWYEQLKWNLWDLYINLMFHIRYGTYWIALFWTIYPSQLVNYIFDGNNWRIHVFQLSSDCQKVKCNIQRLGNTVPVTVISFSTIFDQNLMCYVLFVFQKMWKGLRALTLAVEKTVTVCIEPYLCRVVCCT